MSEHTPGPWYAEKIGETGFSPSVPVYQVRSADQTYTAIADGLSEANARLIAAAPDLLNELRNLVDWAEEYMRYGKAPTYDQPSSARGAILKASSSSEA